MKELVCADCGTKNGARAKYCSNCGMPVGSPRSTTEQKNASPLFGIVGILALLVPVFLLMYCAFSTTVEGEIRSQGKPFGDFQLKPSDCHSGAHENFFGVWVTPELVTVDGRRGFRGGIKLVKNHLNEWDVYVESPRDCRGLECKIQKLTREACQTYVIDVRDTGNVVNDIRVREGRATLECRFPEGGSLSAKLEFDGCS
jgi:hypothetical protein